MPQQHSSGSQNGHQPVADLEEPARLKAEIEDLHREVCGLSNQLDEAELERDTAQTRLRDWRWKKMLGGGTSTFTIRSADASKMRPTEYVWKPWIVRGRLNEIVGEERAGKSTFQAHIAAAVSKGTLPGTFHGKPKDVLFIGCDEDSWETDTMPRLRAAGADFGRIHLFDGGPFNVERDADALAKLLKERDTTFNVETGHFGTKSAPMTYGLIVIEHAMDVLPSMRNYNDPAAMRHATHAFRHVLRQLDVAALQTRHTNKAKFTEFRNAAQGSMQFGAMARSSFLIAKHPTEEGRRVAVLGPNNYVPEGETPALSFEIANAPFSENGHRFSIGRVVDIEQEDLTMAEVLSGHASKAQQEHEDKVEKVLLALTDEPQSERAIANESGVPRSTVQRILTALVDDDRAERTDEGWVAHTP